MWTTLTICFLLKTITCIVCTYGDDAYCLQQHCQCFTKTKTAVCSYLSYIPVLPSFVETLELKHNYLPYISQGTFENISSNFIISLNFSENNSIIKFNSDAFTDLVHLQTLAITGERNIEILSLQNSFQSLNKSSIKYLIFERNGWKNLSDNFLSYLTGANISKLSLSDNCFETLNTSFMRKFFTFKHFVARSNELIFLYADGLQKLEYLDLTDNSISTIPQFCDKYTGLPLVSNLMTLILTNNVIRKLDRSSFKCLDKLQVLNLDENSLTALEDGVFSLLTNIQSLSLNYIQRLTHLGSRAFNSSSLKTLKFVQNGFRFDKNKEINFSEIFKYLPNLTELDLTRNYLPNVPDTLRRMFDPLTKLQNLYLQATFLTLLPDGLLQRMPLLNTLQLNGNKIEHWNQSVFNNVTSLRNLYFGGNHIHIINKTSFPYSLWTSLKKLDLSNNYFWCTCEQKWFTDLIQTTNVTKLLLNWPIRYTCAYPNERNGMNLSSYTPTDADCTEWSLVFTVVIIASSTVFIVFLGILLMFICQANIRNLLYLLRVYNHRRKGYHRLHSSEDYQFDAFVVYCDGDRQWVHKVLLARLEGFNLKVCIHHRDFDVGESITHNIERYMELSWKIVVVMSNNFTKSEWCQWEIDLVQERRRKHGKDALVLIMYSSIDSHHMTSSIRTLLDTTPHLTYQEGFGEDLFWSAAIEAVAKPFTEPPTAVL